MTEISTLDALQALHRDLVALREGRSEGAEWRDSQLVLSIFGREYERFWDWPPRSEASRKAVQSGKVIIDDEEYSLNEQFQQAVLYLSDEANIDEIEAARYMLESEEDQAVLGRQLLECGIIRYHQQRNYVLDCTRLILEIVSIDEDDDVSQIQAEERNELAEYTAAVIFRSTPKGVIPRCMGAMQYARTWLQKVADRITAASVIVGSNSGPMPEEMETIEFSRVSLVQQHELLGVILCKSIERNQAEVNDFKSFLQVLKKADKYDQLLVHLFPALGAYIARFGSTEGQNDITTARELNNLVCQTSDDNSWPLAYLHAAVRAWWLAEYSGFYLDDPQIEGIDLDEEDRQRTKQFMESLKDGAFDFILSIAADVKSPEWQDPARTGIRQWLQRKSPPLVSDSVQFSDFFQLCLMLQLEVFVDAFISNLPDVLRKLRVEEDEQRQLSQAHEQDLDLERFLIIISYSYEGRPDAAMNFWQDPDSNLAGFMHWASRRASTPLVSAFCEMLQALSENDECATFAHEFLLDEGHHASGKMRRSQSLTWTQIFKELIFFSNKIREKPAPSQTLMYRTGKPSTEQAETEPESAMMLECYLRLMTKLSGESEIARQFLLKDPNFNLVEIMYQLASSKIPPRLRACTFATLRALVSRKSQEEGNIMWQCLDSWLGGTYTPGTTSHHRPAQQSPAASMERIFDEIGRGYEEPNAFIQFVTALVSPAEGSNGLNDALPFPENLGSSSRMPGIELYVDFVLGHVLAGTSNDLHDVNQLRMLRLSCMEFALVCLSTFNEDLIVLGNETNIAVDSAISASDLATYVRLHPFARVMEWMFNDKAMTALFNAVHQDILEVGNSSPDTPLILGILRAVEVISKVLDLQATYLDLVRPIIKLQSNQRRLPVANAAYASFEDGLAGHLNLIVDLGNYCGVGHPDLTHACLKLLEKVSSSPKFISTWSGTGPHSHRNKVNVALEANGEYESISRSFISDITSPLDVRGEADSPSYMTKIYILNFLHSTLQASPNQPTIAHLLLGFKCGADTLSVIPTGSFAQRQSLFHGLIRLALETPSGDAQGMRQWLIALKCKSMRILRILWNSTLSAQIVIDELRENEIIFHFLLQQVPIQPTITWENEDIALPQFPITPGATTLVDFLALRDMSLEYVALELCNVSQSRLPSLKRRIFEALNGQIIGDGNEPMAIPTIFDLYDFLLPEGLWALPQPQLSFYKDLDFRICLQDDDESNAIYNLDRAKEILLLKRSESRDANAVITSQDLTIIEKEEAAVLEYLLAYNLRTQIASQSLRTLKTWTSLMLVMVESNDFQGTAKISFLLQVLQAILPSLEAYASDRPEAASELAKLAKVLLFKLDISTTDPLDKQVQAAGNLVSDKLFQLFQVCLQAIGKWAGSGELRGVYYAICYRYLTGMVDKGDLISGRQKTTKAIQVYGERLINVICDDAYGSEPACQTAALILLTALVNTGRQENETHVVEMLNKLNFIGILVDSLRNVLVEWIEIIKTGNKDQQNHHNAKLALLLQLCQTREGAKYVLHANLFRAIELSGLFAADPELQLDPTKPKALEMHYSLLAKVARIIGAAIVSRGSHNVLQGRRFLTDHRMLVSHTLKRSAGIGPVESGLEESIGDLADAFVVIITATGFLDFENDSVAQARQPAAMFH